MKDEKINESITDFTNNNQENTQNVVDKRVLLVGKLKGKKEVEKKNNTTKKNDVKKNSTKTKDNTSKKTKSNTSKNSAKKKVETKKTVKKVSSKNDPKKKSGAKSNTTKKTATAKNDKTKITIKEDTNKLKKEVENKKNNKVKKAEIKSYVLRIREIGLANVSSKTIKDACIVILITALVVSLVYIGYIAEQNISNKIMYSSLSEKFEDNMDKLVAMGAPATDNIKALSKENPDIKGWIRIDGTNINYPLLQGLDNDYYLTHNYKNEYTNYGSIYINSNSNIKDDNSNVIIYGHDMKDGQMFSDLVKYTSEQYYKEHPTIRIMTDVSENEYEIVSVFKSRVFYKDEKNVFRFYQNYNLSDENKYNDYVENCKKLQLYNTNVEAKKGDQLITLITCEYSQENGRIVIVARKK